MAGVEPRTNALEHVCPDFSRDDLVLQTARQMIGTLVGGPRPMVL